MYVDAQTKVYNKIEYWYKTGCQTPNFEFIKRKVNEVFCDCNKKVFALQIASIEQFNLFFIGSHFRQAKHFDMTDKFIIKKEQSQIKLVPED